MHVLEPITPSATYHSPQQRPALTARISPSLFFYLRMLGVLRQASAWSKKGCYNDEKWNHSSRRFLKLLEDTGLHFHVEHLDVLQEKRPFPCIFIANHMSTLETFILPTILLPFTRLSFIIKDSLLHYPLFKHTMRACDPIAVTRENPREDFKVIVTEGCKKLEQGKSVVVFPQTTRTPVFDRTAFNSVGIKLAKKSGAPVVPIALKTDAWGNGRWIKEMGRIDAEKAVHFCFGDPMQVQGSGRDEHEAVMIFIERSLRSW